MSQPLKIAIAGALGRMGRQMAQAVEADPRLELVARFHRPGSAGEGLVERDEALALADVIVDFTTPAASAELATACARRGGPALVVGSTGFDVAELEAIADAASKIAVVRSGSYSLGINMLTGLVERAAELDATEAWGQSPLLRRLAAEVMHLDVKPVKLQLKREPDYMRALHYLVKQYGPTLETAMFEEGSWEAVGRLLGVVASE